MLTQAEAEGLMKVAAHTQAHTHAEEHTCVLTHTGLHPFAHKCLLEGLL